MTSEPDMICSQCSRPLPTDSPSGICPKCRSALFSLANEPALDTDEKLGPESEMTGESIWSELRSELPDREFIGELGRGGMGSVLLLRNHRLERDEALKVLLPERSSDPRFEERFLRESSVLAQLRHPHIVTMHQCSDVDGLLYILMDYVDGGTLRQAIAETSLRPEDRIRIISELAAAIAHAHLQGIIHRDINPANVLLTQEGSVRVVDFGLSKQVHTAAGDLSVTRPNEVMGTYAYMAPEQHDGSSQGDKRSDVYSLGALAYELLTRRLPRGRFSSPFCRIPSVPSLRRSCHEGP